MNTKIFNEVGKQATMGCRVAQERNVMENSTMRTIEPSLEAREDYERTPFVTYRFVLNLPARERIRKIPFKFGFDEFGPAVYYDKYSREKKNGFKETWPDTVLRVIDGIFTIRYDWYMKMRLPWNEAYWQALAEEMAEYMMLMYFLPPGRGLWAMGTDYIYDRGSMAANNCAATNTDNLSSDIPWLMDALMCGAGVGAEVLDTPVTLHMPIGEPVFYDVPDTREGWVESERLLLESYENSSNPIEFGYSRLRKAGAKLKGLGGVSAGPEPLMKLHGWTRQTCEKYIAGDFGPTRLRADLANQTGVCVVMGNLRRSAILLLGSVHDKEFLNLKNYDLYPDRKEWGWVSNNSVRLYSHEDFEAMPVIADGIRRNGEPGMVNLKAIQMFGRFGREMEDKATLLNPCSEIPLEHRELCNLVECFPSRCPDDATILRAMELACIYSSTVSLLPTHSASTNDVIARNRRIGVSISGLAEWSEKKSWASITRLMRDGYKRVRRINKALATEAGVPVSIRVTTVKPSGTISKLAGVSAGMHYPTFNFVIRRFMVSKGSAVREIISRAGIPHEESVYDRTCDVFEFPVHLSSARAAAEVSAFEQALRLCAMQREWADNSVSCTIYYNPETESGHLEHMLAQIAPMVKSVSVLPHSDGGAYEQMPEEGITKEEYERRKAVITPIDWTNFRGEDGTGERYCSTDVCEVPVR